MTNLKDAVKLRQWLTGSGDLPIVKLSNAPMKTKFGKKLRPDFKIVAWRSFGGGPTQVEGGGAPQIKDASAKPTAARSTEELLNDEIPF